MVISVALRLRALADLGVTMALIGEVMNGRMFSLLLLSSMSKVARERLGLGNISNKMAIEIVERAYCNCGGTTLSRDIRTIYLRRCGKVQRECRVDGSG
jgi:hypothetical protein